MKDEEDERRRTKDEGQRPLSPCHLVTLSPCHSSLVTRHSSLVTRHSSLVVAVRGKHAKQCFHRGRPHHYPDPRERLLRGLRDRGRLGAPGPPRAPGCPWPAPRGDRPGP